MLVLIYLHDSFFLSSFAHQYAMIYIREEEREREREEKQNFSIEIRFFAPC